MKDVDPNRSGGTEDVAILIDRSLAAHREGQQQAGDAFARCAQALLEAEFPQFADDISDAASRKGNGVEIGQRLARSLSAEAAAAVSVVLLLRRARAPVTKGLSGAFAKDPAFQAMARKLCERVYDRASTGEPSSIEVTVPRSR